MTGFVQMGHIYVLEYESDGKNKIVTFRLTDFCIFVGFADCDYNVKLHTAAVTDSSLLMLSERPQWYIKSLMINTLLDRLLNVY